MVATGHRHYNDEQQEHGQQTVGVAEYLATGAFIESCFENWESEFLQMGLYVLLTAFFFQIGSAGYCQGNWRASRDGGCAILGA
jgi:hypothetical protein